MSPDWVPLEFTEWVVRSGLLVLGLSLAWSIIGARVGRRLAIALTFLTACLSLPWAILSPSIWQARRTWLFLPITARHWPEPTRRRVLLHELGHVHGRDGWLMMVWRVLDVFHWWNPCWWRLRSQWELGGRPIPPAELESRARLR